MNEPHDKRSDSQIQFLRALLAEQASIDDDVLEVGNDTWMIHGVVPYDGEEPMAVFDTPDAARRVLDELRGAPAADEL